MRFVGRIAVVIQVISVRNPSFLRAFTEQPNARRNRLSGEGLFVRISLVWTKSLGTTDPCARLSQWPFDP